MSRNTSRIDVSCTDSQINRIFSGITEHELPRAGSHTCYYNQNEDQFILLRRPIEIPAIPVHQTLDDKIPPAGYIEMIAGLGAALAELCPELVAGTKWYFDPIDIHAPTFYRVSDVQGTAYIYQLLVDLTCRPLECEITETGTNDRTHAYRTDRLYFECDWFPAEKIDSERNLITLQQSIPVTWKGEAGQGYMIHGIWMDADINKFFSKLILPPGKRNYPYYPVTCKQHCVSMNAFGQRSPDLLHRIRDYIEPSLDSILGDLQTTAFSELSPLFQQIKSTIPDDLGRGWENLSVRVALNEREQKEYTVEF